MSINKKDFLWTEKYRPSLIQNAVLPQRLKDKFADGLYGNVMLQGFQGTGKTTLARILIGKSSVLMLNGSLENSVDDVRDRIIKFCSIGSFDGGKKIVFIDEADGLSQAAQAGLRGTIEKFHLTTLFLFTCNYPEKILDPIRSRFEIINFNYSDPSDIAEVEKGYIMMMVEICKREGIAIPNAEGIKELTKRHFPDFRSGVNVLQGIHRTSKVLDLDSLRATARGDVDEEFYTNLINNNHPAEMYKYVKAKFTGKETKAYDVLSSQFLEYLLDEKVGKSQKVGEVAATVHKYQYESAGAVDKLVPLLACCFAINRLIR